MTVADSFNGSGCGPNYEHDEEHNEEHDEGYYPHLNFNGGISLDNLNTHGVYNMLKNINDKSRLAQNLLDEHDELKKLDPNMKKAKFDEWNTKVQDYMKNSPSELHSKSTANTLKPKSLFQKINELAEDHPGLETYVNDYGNLKNVKERYKWNKGVLHYCKENGIDLGPKPVRTKKETNKVNAKAHHLEHFSVAEHTDEHGRHFLKIYVKKHHPSKQQFQAAPQQLPTDRQPQLFPTAPRKYAAPPRMFT